MSELNLSYDNNGDYFAGKINETMHVKDLGTFFLYMNYSINNSPCDYSSVEQSHSGEFMFEVQAHYNRIMVRFMPKLKCLEIVAIMCFF